MWKRAKTMRLGVVAGAVFLSSAMASTPSLGGQELTPTRAPGTLGAPPVATTRASLSGRWELNGGACEPVQFREHRLPPARGRGRSILSGPSQEEMRRVAEPQPALVIARHAESYSVTGEDGRVLVLRPDGVKVKDRRPGPALERTTKWNGPALVTEARLSNGARVTQTYTTEDDGLRLVITTRVEGGRSVNRLTYKWVYDLALQ